MAKYDYYTLSESGKRKDLYCSYTDIAFEFGVTKGSIAGKFDRARRKNSNIITIGDTKIERISQESPLLL